MFPFYSRLVLKFQTPFQAVTQTGQEYSQKLQGLNEGLYVQDRNVFLNLPVLKINFFYCVIWQ